MIDADCHDGVPHGHRIHHCPGRAQIFHGPDHVRAHGNETCIRRGRGLCLDLCPCPYLCLDTRGLDRGSGIRGHVLIRDQVRVPVYGAWRRCHPPGYPGLGLSPSPSLAQCLLVLYAFG